MSWVRFESLLKWDYLDKRSQLLTHQQESVNRMWFNWAWLCWPCDSVHHVAEAKLERLILRYTLRLPPCARGCLERTIMLRLVRKCSVTGGSSLKTQDWLGIWPVTVLHYHVKKLNYFSICKTPEAAAVLRIGVKGCEGCQQMKTCGAC